MYSADIVHVVVTELKVMTISTDMIPSIMIATSSSTIVKARRVIPASSRT